MSDNIIDINDLKEFVFEAHIHNLRDDEFQWNLQCSFDHDDEVIEVEITGRKFTDKLQCIRDFVRYIDKYKLQCVDLLG